MSSHPLTSLLSLPAPTVAEWESVRSFGLDNLSPNVSPSRKYRFNGLAGCMVLMTVLYSINLFEALIKKRLWLFKTDKAGYWHPNLQTLIPLLSCIMSMLLFSSIMLQNADYNKYLRTSTMITQLLAYYSLYFCAVTHTWRILAVLPLTPFHLREGDGHQTPPISPRAFNAFICAFYLTFSAVFLPLQIWMARTAATAGAMWFQIMPTLDDLIQNKQQMNATELQDLRQFAIRGLEKLTTPKARSFLLWRVVCGIYTLYITVQLFVYVYASIKLMTTLEKQLKVIRYAAIHAAQLANITISATIGLPDFSPPRKPERSRSRAWKSLHLFWMWVISDEEFSSRVWNDSIVNGVMDEVRHLEEKHKVINRSRNIIASHLMIVGAVIASYWVLAACLTIDVFGAGTRTPAVEIVLITQEWGDWAWGIPGLLLSIIACCTTFMPCLNGQIQNKSTIDSPKPHQSLEVDPDHHLRTDKLIPRTLDSSTARQPRTYFLYPFQRGSRNANGAVLPFERSRSKFSLAHCQSWPHLSFGQPKSDHTHTKQQQQPTIIDLSHNDNQETLRATDISIVKAYAAEEELLHRTFDAQNSSDLDVIRHLRAQDARDLKTR